MLAICRAALAVLFVAGTLATSVLAQDPWMSEDEMMQMIVGHGTKGRDSGRSYSEKYNPDGTISGVWGGEYYDGKWFFYEGQMCFDYEGSAYDECWYLQVEGDQIVYFDKDGVRQDDTTDWVENP